MKLHVLDHLGHLAVHPLPQSQSSNRLLQGYSLAQEKQCYLQNLMCLPEYGTLSILCKCSLVSGTTGTEQ